MKLSNNEEYKLAEFVFALQTKTLIKHEAEDVIKILQDRGNVISPRAKKILREKAPKKEAASLSDMLEQTIEKTRVDDRVEMYLVHLLRLYITDKQVSEIMDRYTSGKLKSSG